MVDGLKTNISMFSLLATCPKKVVIIIVISNLFNLSKQNKKTLLATV